MAIKFAMINKTISKIKDIYIGIKNIVRWLSVIYHDRDYDYAYVFELLNVKFEHMEQYFKNNIHISKENEMVAEEIKVAKLLSGWPSKGGNPAQEQKRIEYLFDYLKKNIKKWWI